MTPEEAEDLALRIAKHSQPSADYQIGRVLLLIVALGMGYLLWQLWSKGLPDSRPYLTHPIETPSTASAAPEPQVQLPDPSTLEPPTIPWVNREPAEKSSRKFVGPPRPR